MTGSKKKRTKRKGRSPKPQAKWLGGSRGVRVTQANLYQKGDLGKKIPKVMGGRLLRCTSRVGVRGAQVVPPLDEAVAESLKLPWSALKKNPKN